jgi:hypothetical protein
VVDNGCSDCRRFENLDLSLELIVIKCRIVKYRLLLHELGFGAFKQDLNLGGVGGRRDYYVSQAPADRQQSAQRYRQIAAAQECERQTYKIADTALWGSLATWRPKLGLKHINVLKHVSGIRLCRDIGLDASFQASVTHRMWQSGPNCVQIQISLIVEFNRTCRQIQ